MLRQRLLALLVTSCATLSVPAVAAETAPSLSVRPTVFAGSNDLDNGAFGTKLYLGVTARTQAFAPGLTAEAELSLFANDKLELSDNSSYLRLNWRPSGWRDAEGLSFTLLPLHSERIYLGFEFPLTDRIEVQPGPAGPQTGLELRLTRQRWYAFVAAKSQMLAVTYDVYNHRGYTELVGGGVDVVPALRVEAEAAHVDLGTNYLRDGGVPLDRVNWGGAARITFHRGSPIGPPADYQRYAGDPAVFEKLLRPELYDDPLSMSLSAEMLYLSEHGLLDASNTPTSQSGFGTSVEGRVKWKRLRAFLRGQVRSPKLLWFAGGPLQAQPLAGPIENELSLFAAADYHFPGTGLTPGLSVEVIRPGSLASTALSPTGIQGPIVISPQAGFELLPQGADVELSSRTMATLRWQLGQFSALADLFVQHDPNRTMFYDSGNGSGPEIVFTRATSFGFDLMLQTRF